MLTLRVTSFASAEMCVSENNAQKSSARPRASAADLHPTNKPEIPTRVWPIKRRRVSAGKCTGMVKRLTQAFSGGKEKGSARLLNRVFNLAAGR